MNEQGSLAGITFTENGNVDVAQLNALYRYIGWDSHNRRTETETIEMLRVSHYYIAAHTAEGTLVGIRSCLWRPVRGPSFRCHHAPCVSPSWDCEAVYARGAGAPAAVSLCVCDFDR